jgi:hypothetical protein
MAHDVLVVSQKQVIGEVRPPVWLDVETKSVVEAGNVILIEAFKLRCLQLGGQIIEFGHTVLDLDTPKRLSSH